MMRLRLRLGALLTMAVVSIALTAAPAASQKTALRWKHNPGSELVYRMANQQQIDLAAMGGGVTSELIQTMRWRVVDVTPDGDATISVTTERVQVEMRSVAGNVSFDSETGEPPVQPQARIFAGLVGSSYTIVIGPTGQVRSVRGLDELRRHALDAMPPEQAAAVRSMTDQLFSEESLSRMMQQGFQLFPEEPVGPGDSWPSSLSIPLPMLGTLNTSMTYSLAGLEERDGRTVASIAVSGDVSLGRDESSQLPMTMDISDTQLTGTVEFDTDRGIMLSSEMAMTMQMAIEAGGQRITAGLDQKTSVELIERSRSR